MGSVPDLYTTGDNDPEIEPRRYFRHYLYCDVCGSFDLEPWIEPPYHHRLEAQRRRLARAALLSAILLVAVPGWLAVGPLPSPALLLAVIAGISLALLIRRWLVSIPQRSDAKLETFVRWLRALLPWLAGVAAVQWLATDFPLPLWALPAAGAVLMAGSLARRAALGSRIELEGERCRRCGATYAYGTPFFTDLDANPLHLTVDDVPRPLGSSLFREGRPADDAPGVPSTP